MAKKKDHAMSSVLLTMRIITANLRGHLLFRPRMQMFECVVEKRARELDNRGLARVVYIYVTEEE